MGNHIILSGNVSYNRLIPQIKQAKSGVFFIPFTLETYRLNNDQKHVTYHRIVVFGHEEFLSESILPFLEENAFVSVVGEMRYAVLQNNDGRNHHLAEVFIQPSKNVGSIEFTGERTKRGVS